MVQRNWQRRRRYHLVECDGHAGGDDHECSDAMMLELAMSVVLECSSPAREAPTTNNMPAPGTCDMPSSLCVTAILTLPRLAC